MGWSLLWIRMLNLMHLHHYYRFLFLLLPHFFAWVPFDSVAAYAKNLAMKEKRSTYLGTVSFNIHNLLYQFSLVSCIKIGKVLQKGFHPLGLSKVYIVVGSGAARHTAVLLLCPTCGAEWFWFNTWEWMYGIGGKLIISFFGKIFNMYEKGGQFGMRRIWDEDNLKCGRFGMRRIGIRRIWNGENLEYWEFGMLRNWKADNLEWGNQLRQKIQLSIYK